MTAPELKTPGILERRRVGAFVQSLEGRLVECNESCAAILGYDSAEELVRLGGFEYFTESDPATIVAAIGDLGAVNNVDVCMRRRNGTLIWVSMNLGLIERDGESMMEGVLFETTDQRVATQRFEHQVTHDPITGLPNRNLFFDRLLVAMAQAQRRERMLAVAVVDLDHFDLINATFGRGLADRILKAVGNRLLDALRIEDTIARFGSDEFSIILSDVEDELVMASIAQRLLEAVSRPIRIENHEIRVNASIGIAISPADGSDPETLVKHADAAMYRAKDVGRNTWQFYAAEVNARSFERQMVVRSLSEAIAKDQFVLHYQPQINVQTGNIDCLEALIRWQHPELGTVEPAEFLPAAEQGGLIPRIGEWVIRTAARQIRAWQLSGIKSIRIAVNLSWRQFQQPDLIKRLGAIILEEGIDPGLLELEISERTMQNTDRTMTTLLGLKNLGVKLALDDFGTGRSSLSDLKRLPFDTVKIDTSHIRNVVEQIDDAALVQAVVLMARALGVRVVAEGVERKDQLSFLRDRSCLEMQGFFFGQPMPAFGMEELLRMQH
jgi:diguanylate cyclase (GGDEF)-like protein/PAS domain S-box-containing protein